MVLVRTKPRLDGKDRRMKVATNRLTLHRSPVAQQYGLPLVEFYGCFRDRTALMDAAWEVVNADETIESVTVIFDDNTRQRYDVTWTA